MNEKACEACGQNIKRVGYLTREKRWAKARFCSRPCAGVAHSGASHYAILRSAYALPPGQWL